MTEVTPPAEAHREPKQPAISFEFFPPKTAEMEKSLWETIKRLAPLAPNFVSVTYGAGGSTRERTHSTITRILNETGLTPAAHLTCVGAPKGEIDDVVARYHEVGVRHIVALRGDPAGGIGTAYLAHPEGYQSSADLVAGIKRRYPDIEVSVSAYPEKHPESTRLRRRHRHAAGQGRRRRGAGHYAGVLRQRSVPALPRPRARPRHQDPGRARHHADAQFQAGARLRHQGRHHGAGRGWRTSSKASTTTPRPASWWRPPSPPTRCASSPRRVSTPSISTP